MRSQVAGVVIHSGVVEVWDGSLQHHFRNAQNRFKLIHWRGKNKKGKRRKLSQNVCKISKGT